MTRNFGFLRRCTSALGSCAPAPILGAVCCLSLTIACPDIGAAQDGTPEKKSIAVTSVPTANTATLQIALQKGYFRDVGLDVAARYNQSGAVAINAVLAGSADIANANLVSAILARNEGLSLLIISQGDSAVEKWSGVFVTKDSPIRTPKDLEGKTVATSGLTNVGPVTINQWLKHNGVDYSKVNWVELPFPNMLPAMQQGSVASIWLVEPFTSVALAAEARWVLDNFSGPTANFPVSSFVARADFTEKHPNTLAAFNKALARAAQEANADRNAVVQVLPSYTPIKPELAQKIVLTTYLSGVNRNAIQRVVDTMKDVAWAGFAARSRLENAASSYVDRILRGAKVSDLPVQLPTNYELVVNVKTAKAIGLTIPEAFLLHADELIE
jgi:NitT/TauT family transport system substrate-binding protein